MPILDVLIVGEPAPPVREGLAQRLAEAAAQALDSRPGGTWVTVRILDPRDYAENGGAPDGVAPVFVRLIERVPAEQPALEARLRGLTDAVAEACARDRENVHVVLEPAGAGRITFGGALVR